MTRLYVLLARLGGRRAFLVGCLVLTAGLALADPRARAALQRPLGGSGLVIVPDHFLRPWDPVTIFFPTAVGTSGGGPEDHPDRLVTVRPEVEGAWEWLDARTLQFRPAVPWPGLGRSRWRVGGEEMELLTLMVPPIRTDPPAEAVDLPPVEAFTLVFPTPVDENALVDMVSLELIPMDGGPVRWLGSRDFRVKALPGGDAALPDATPDTGSAPTGGEGGFPYELRFDEAIPLGMRVVAHLRLSLDDSHPDGFARIAFATAEPFRVASVGCGGGGQMPVGTDGIRYPREEVLQCGGAGAPLVVRFSAPPQAVGPVEARNLLRFSPAVPDLAFVLNGRELQVTGRFEVERTYEVTVSPTPLRDVADRPLANRSPTILTLSWPRSEPFLRWAAADGLAERFGPKQLPAVGRAITRADLRVVKVDPLDRGFWPFPSRVVMVDENHRPPGPGEEPEEDAIDGRPSPETLATRIQLLGPSVSALVDLPLDGNRAASNFGLDLAPHLAKVSGRDAPGTYLVGLRHLDTSSTRAWMRVQVTDLSLTAVEESKAVRFFVTSLRNGGAVGGAEVRLEGVRRTDSGPRWEVFGTGRTGSDGSWLWTAPGPDARQPARLRRIVVVSGDDTLVLDPEAPPPAYVENHWQADQEPWLGWVFDRLEGRGDDSTLLAHLFTERPVYRPEDEVHIKGWLRERTRGVLSVGRVAGEIVVEGPGDLSWRQAVTPSATGAIYWKFHADEAPTGTYFASFVGPGNRVLGRVSFDVEAYRLPDFEALLSAPESAALDRPFDVQLTASYFAGGRVSGRPVRWRVTQFPHDWSPTTQAGFLYSSDGRYSGVDHFRATPRFEKVSRTDADGGARITLDPTIEPSATPRTYVVEATVTGADDLTVTAVKRVVTLPAFVLGVKLPRYVATASVIHPEVLAVGGDGRPVVGQEITVRLYRRTWQSVLQAADFSRGGARYLTDVVDLPLAERTVRSVAGPLGVDLPVDRAGVYLVELEARDRMGRAQVVRADLYVGGDEAVAWPKPEAGVFTLATDRASYEPGATARIVVQSPFADAEALVVIEAPEGNRYSWQEVRGGVATVSVPVLPSWAPDVPVHVLLARGRSAAAPGSVTGQDLGKPTTLASTTKLVVNPSANRIRVELTHAPRATPGETVPVTVHLRLPDGRPTAGEVSLWLVDAAVLSLGKEQRLDPLPDFIPPVPSRLRLRDTRNLTFGRIPFAEAPGGDAAATEEESPLDRATIRKDFRAVPYYAPALVVGADGKLTVSVKLPDNLTTFRVRAKAVGGAERFGFGTSEIAVRLPVLVQPALPRFVRPGDTFSATAIGRVVEGAGGPGSAQIRGEGVTLLGPDRLAVSLSATEPTPIRFPVKVDARRSAGTAPEVVRFRLALSRGSDGASDGFEVALPLRDDVRRTVERQLLELPDGKEIAIPGPGEPPRAGTFSRRWLAADQRGLLQLVAALDWFERYPYGTTDARVSRARAWLALGSLRASLGLTDGDTLTDRAVQETLAWLPQVVDGSGLVADLPGARASVARTAWTASFLTEAREAGYGVDAALERTLLDALRRSLRSDFRGYLDGEAWVERAWALEALAGAGQFDPAYFAELARTAQFRDAEGLAAVVLAGVRGGQVAAPAETRLVDTLAGGIVTRLWQGKEIYGGLGTQRTPRSPFVLPSETRTLADMTRALVRARPDHPRVLLLLGAIEGLGTGNGWGNTNANAAAVLALVDGLRGHPAGSWTVDVRAGSESFQLAPAGQPVATRSGTTGGPAKATGRGSDTLALWVQSEYLPDGDGALVPARAEGFVLSREMFIVDPAGPARRVSLAEPGTEVRLPVGAVVEEHVQLVVPADHHFVALTVPLAAGVDPLNPRLATSPPEATPKGRLTLEPVWSDWRDDQVRYFYELLPRGTYDFYFRTRATVPGRFVIPAADAELLYDSSVRGRSAGGRLVVE